jgi:fucose 4-O-acetylase-like acetyltransferase
MANKRDLSVDIAKGIGIMLVVAGHACCPDVPHAIIYSFHMPLFFMLSGLFIERQCQTDFTTYLKKNFKALVLPFFYFNLIYIAVYFSMSVVFHKSMLNGSVQDNLIGTLVGMRFGTPYRHTLWFLLCLFCAKMIVYPLFRSAKLRGGGYLFISSLLLIAGLVYGRLFDFTLPWSLDAALVAVFFLVVGQVFMQHRAVFEKYIRRYWFVLVAIWSASVYFNFNEVEMFKNQYGNEALFLAGSLSASLLVLWLCGQMKSINGKVVSLIAQIGVLSLLVYALQNFGLQVPLWFRGHLLSDSAAPWQDYAYWIASTLFALVFILPVSKLIIKKLPWLAGK